MKRMNLFSFGSGLLILAILFGLSVPAAARPASQEPPPPGQKFDQEWADQDYLLPLPEPQIEDLQAMSLPSDPSPRQLEEAATFWTRQTAERYRPLLERLRAGGKISGYEIRLDLKALLLHGVTNSKEVNEMSPEPLGLGILPARVVESCSAQKASELGSRFYALNQLARMEEGSTDQGNLATQAAPVPTIHLVVNSWAGWAGLVYGKAAPNSPVILYVYRQGRKVASISGQTNRRGSYLLTTGSDCNSSSNSIAPGDMVEVTAAGKNAFARNAEMSGWVDPFNNTVSGKVPFEYQVEIHLYNNTNTCGQARVYKKVITSPKPSGEFSYNFNGQPDFNGLASAVIYALDSHGNSTELSVQAYHLEYTLGGHTLFGIIKPDPEVTYTATLITGSTVESYPIYVGWDGSFGNYFNEAIQPGSVLKVSGGDITLTSVARLMEVHLDATHNRVYGTTEPYWLVEARFDNYPVASCKDHQPCRKARVSSSGQFSMNAGYDVQHGDQVQVNLVDAQGNSEKSPVIHVPALEIGGTYPNNIYVFGYWYTSGKNLYLEVLASDHQTVVCPSYYLGSSDWFNGWVVCEVHPGDFLRVTDEDNLVEEMTLVDLSATFNTAARKIGGSTGTGRLVIKYYDFRPGNVYWSVNLCQRSAVRAPQYRLSVRGARMGPGDWVNITHIGPEGNYTSTYAQALTLKTSLYTDSDSYGSQVTVYPPYSSGRITLILKDTQGVEYSQTATVTEDGHTFTFAQAIHAGYTLEVLNPDLPPGEPLLDTIIIPADTTIQEDSVQNRLYGQTWPNTVLWAYLTLSNWWDQRYGYAGRQIWSNPSGQYSAAFEGMILPYARWLCPVPAQVGAPCIIPVILVYSPGGHMFYYYKMPYQTPTVPPDAYEPDNSSAEARPYTGASHHTLPDGDSDWIQFTVNQEDIGKTYLFETFQVDTNLHTSIALIDTDGTSWIGESQPGLGGSAWLEYTFQTPGIYYVRIMWESDSTYSCSETYDFRITQEAP